MEIEDLITPQSVIARLRATSKKQVLQELAKRAAEAAGLQERAIFDVLLERERLGTTGVGDGIAIPHGKLPELRRLHGLFARLETPVDGLDRVVHGRLHETQVDLAGRRRRGDDGFHGDCIPIGDGIGAGRRYPSRG